MEQKQYWDSVSEVKEFTLPFQGEKFARFVGKDACVLDVGCGYGRTLNELWQAGYQNLIGIDFAPGMIQRGRRQFPQLDLRVKTGDPIDLPDSSVNAVILFAVLTCIHDSAQQQALVGEIFRVLKPGGVLYVNDYLLNTDARNVARYEQFAERFGVYGIFELPEGAICRHHSEEWIETLFQDFERLDYEHLTYTTMNGHQAQGFSLVVRRPLV